MAHPQKDTKWSTEAELAGMNDVPSPTVCTRVVYCPTRDMVADLFTEPLQEASFQRLCNMIMNIPRIIGPASIATACGHRSVLGMDDRSRIDTCVLIFESIERNTMDHGSSELRFFSLIDHGN